MKKAFKVLISIFIIAIILMLNMIRVYAADELTSNAPAELTIVANKTNVKIGDIVTLDVKVKCIQGIEALDAILDYDSIKLQLQENETEINSSFSNMSGKDEKTGKYQLTVLSNTTSDIQEAKLITVKFKVLNNVKDGENIKISLKNIQIGDSNDKWYEISEKNVQIKVYSGANMENGNNGNIGENIQQNVSETKVEGGLPHTGNNNLPKVLFTIILLFISMVTYKKYNSLKGI